MLKASRVLGKIAMDSLDVEVLERCLEWSAAGHAVVLVTVTHTWGSSPRPVGSILALRGDGAVWGSVSGGCIEDDLIERARLTVPIATRPDRVVYGVSAEEARRFGLPCGGTIELVLEPVRAAAPVEADQSGDGAGSLAALAYRLAKGERVARELDLATGRARLRPASRHEQLFCDGKMLVTVHGPSYRLLLIGAGDLAYFLARMAVGLGYQVTVCDPREEYAQQWNMQNVRLTRSMPDDTVLEMRLDSHSAVVALTHDPKLDDLALIDALQTDAFYVAAIGSRFNSARRRERLKLFEISDAEIGRLRGPAGLAIGSRTPFEIAVAIAAEMTAAKNGITFDVENRRSVTRGGHGDRGLPASGNTPSEGCPVLNALDPD